MLQLSPGRAKTQQEPGGGDADASTYIPRVLWLGLWLAGTTFALGLGGSLLV